MEFYIGIMSGTSADGINIALVDFESKLPKLIAAQYTPYPNEIRQKILTLYQTGSDEIQRLGELDVMIGQLFAQSVNHLLSKQDFNPKNIRAIGSHGQTIRHSPYTPTPFTLQIGDPNTIAALTGITTIADFRRKDIAHGGQGAPLTPAFHEYILSFFPQKNRVIINIGGIANITCLLSDDLILGFDTGPGNALLDAWIEYQLNEAYDKKGQWANQGTIHLELLELLLSDDYFNLLPPKSTGREYFHLPWLLKKMAQIEKKGLSIEPKNVQATLIELTVHSIMKAIKQYFSQGELLVCGGGIHNDTLMHRLNQAALPHFSVASTEKYGVAPDWMEAMAFAWLAKQTIHHQPGNHPQVTGAQQRSILGGIYLA